MDTQTYLLGLLSGVVIVACLPVFALLVGAFVNILLSPSVAHAPEIDPEAAATREELRRQRDEVERLIREGEAHLAGGH